MLRSILWKTAAAILERQIESIRKEDIRRAVDWILNQLRKLSARTGTSLDDKLIEKIETALLNDKQN